MDKSQKFEYQTDIEEKLQNLEVFEMFQDLLKQLVIVRPEKPYDFLIQKIQGPSVKRVFMLGPPGANRVETAEALAKDMEWSFISTGEACRAEAEKGSSQGKAISKCLKDNKFVDDDLVVDVVQKEIQKAEKTNKSWIIEGFPRTRVQALSFQKLGVVPDKVVQLSCSTQTSLDRIQANIREANSEATNVSEQSESLYREWDVNSREVNNTFNQFVYTYDCGGKAQQEVVNDLARILRVRFRNGAPRSPPRVILVGPSGSGRTTQAQIIANNFGLVCIEPDKLVRDEMQKQHAIHQRVTEALDKGGEIPDDIYQRQISQRLAECDCQVNGWVIDGYPRTTSQIHGLFASNLKCNLICMLDQSEETSLSRTANRRVDPQTGQIFNLSTNVPKSLAQGARLVPLDQDGEARVKKSCVAWTNSKEGLKSQCEKEVKSPTVITLPAERSIDEVADQIADAIQNPVF